MTFTLLGLCVVLMVWMVVGYAVLDKKIKALAGIVHELSTDVGRVLNSSAALDSYIAEVRQRAEKAKLNQRNKTTR